MVRIALCDDDTAFHAPFEQQLRSILQEKHLAYECTFFQDAPALLQAFENGSSFDLLFLDVLIGQDNGVSLAKELRSRKLKLDLIFVTTSSEYALDGYDTAPLHYLMKPLSPQ